jgi:hypothetical protein
MIYRHRAPVWVSAVFRDYGPEAWDDGEHAVRRAAEFVVLDPDALAHRCALLRGLEATAAAPRRAVAEVSRRAMDRASPEAIRAVLADPAALCEVHLNAWISVGPWAEAVMRYRSRRMSISVRRYAAGDDLDLVEHEVVLGGRSSPAEIRGTIELRRALGASASENSWRLTIRFPAVAVEPGADRREGLMHRYRDRSILVECPGLHDDLRLKVLLQMNDRGDLVSDSYTLEGVDPTSEGFAFTLDPDPDGKARRRG